MTEFKLLGRFGVVACIYDRVEWSGIVAGGGVGEGEG